MSDLVGRELGQYQLREMVRRGGMATVYKGFQPSLERWVAVKVLTHTGDPTFLSRFRLEARSIARLQHPNIVPIHDYGEAEGQVYLVVAYVEDGRSLADEIGTPMDTGRALELGALLLAGLGYAHERGLVHRDVKPANVLLPTPNWPMLADFGIAKLLLGGGAGLTQTGLVVGTPAYMAPEQAFGLPVDPRTDLYATGLVLYELLTGRVPFEADTPAAALMKQAYEPPPSPRSLNPELPVEVEQVLLKALAKDPNDRYQDAEAMAQALRAASGELPVRTHPAATPPAPAMRAEEAPAWAGANAREPLGEAAVPAAAGPVTDAMAAAYAAGVAAYSTGRWHEAVERFTAIAEADPDYEDVEELLESARTTLDRERRAQPLAPDRPGPGGADDAAYRAGQAPSFGDPGRAAVMPETRPAPAAPPWQQAPGVPVGPAPADPPPPTRWAGAGDHGQPPAWPAEAVKVAPRQDDRDLAPPRDEPPSRWRGWLVPGIAALLGVIALVLLGLSLSRDRDTATSPPATSAARTTTSAPPAKAAPAWAAVTPGPLALESAGTAAFKGQVWVAAGFDENRKARNDVVVYDPATKTWDEGPTLPQTLTHGALVGTNKELLLIGGYRGETETPIRTVRRLDPASGAWGFGTRLPAAIAAGAAAWDGKRVVFAGGVTANGKPSSAVYALEGSTWQQIGNLSKAREHLAAVSDGKGTTWFLAGEANAKGVKTVFGEVDVVKGDTVKKLGTVDKRGSVAGFYSPKDGACVAGGRDGAGNLFDLVECVDATGEVKALASLKTARHGLGAAVVKGRAFALLGAASRNLKTGEVLQL